MRWLLTLLVVMLAWPLQADDLKSRLEAIMDGPDYKNARWGVQIVNAESGAVLFERNPETLIAPASVTKLYSCAAALIALGPDHRFVTPVYRRGKVSASGILNGDLILVASGDLTFGGRTTKDGTVAFTNGDHTYANSGLAQSTLTDSNPLAGLEALAKQIADAGIKEVTGEILIDDRLFARTRGSGSGPDSVTPILVNDNVVDVIITPAKEAGKPATVTIRPETAFVQLDAEVVTGSAMIRPEVTITAPGVQSISVRGRIPLDSKPMVRIFPVEDPAAFARCLFIESLRRNGVRVNAPLARPLRVELPEESTYSTLTKVAEFTSPPLKDAIRVTLKVSHNLYASTLPCLIAVKNGKKTAEEGLRAQGQILKELGVDAKSISFGGGAGGAQSDYVTPKATVQLLQGMRKRPEWDAYRAGFPSLGFDGTLHDVVPEHSPARDKVFGKTGTLIWTDAMNGRFLLRSKALAGVTKTKKGTELSFALFVNDVPLPTGVMSSREGKVLGKIAETIYMHGP